MVEIAYTLQTVANRFYTEVYNPSKNFYPEADVFTWINEALTELCTDSGLLEGYLEIAAVAGTSDYLYSAMNVVKLNRIKYNGKRVYPKTPDEMDAIQDNATDTGASMYWTLYEVKNTISAITAWRRYISFFPTPSLTGDVIRIYGTFNIDVLTATDPVPEVLSRHVTKVMTYLRWKAKVKAGDSMEADNLYKQWLMEKNLALKNKRPKSDGPSKVTNIEDLGVAGQKIYGTR